MTTKMYSYKRERPVRGLNVHPWRSTHDPNTGAPEDPEPPAPCHRIRLGAAVGSRECVDEDFIAAIFGMVEEGESFVICKDTTGDMPARDLRRHLCETPVRLVSLVQPVMTGGLGERGG